MGNLYNNIILACIATMVIMMVSGVNGHARLVSPTPLNPNAVNSPPCGVANMPANKVATATWVVGNTAKVSWQKLAGDGGTSAYGWIDPAGGTNFGTTAAWTGAKDTNNGLITYDFVFTVPAVTCTGPNGLCTLQVISNTGNWVSCAYVNITTCKDCPLPTEGPPQCKKVGNLNFCNQRSGSSVYIAASADASIIDAQALEAFNRNLANPNVFSIGNKSLTCKEDYKNFLCSDLLPTCPGTGQAYSSGSACRGQCKATMKSCGITELHQNLYDCEDYHLCEGESSLSAPLSSLSFVVALASVFAFAYSML